MFNIRAGSVAVNEPKLIWVKALEVPQVSREHLLVREKFNHILEETLCNRKNSFILEVTGIKTSHFDMSHYLLAEGRIKFWQEVDERICKFDRKLISLKPSKIISMSRSQSTQGKKKLPTPPPRHGNNLTHSSKS